MFDLKDISTIKGWFKEEGPHEDVILSSRIRLARNLADYSFPHMMSGTDEKEAEEKIVSAFKGINNDNVFEIIKMDEISPIERKMLLERNFITQDFSLKRHKVVVLNRDETVSVMVNEEEHLRIASIHAGLALEKAYRDADDLDSMLEDYLHYAVSLEWGYLNTSLNDIGTGLRSSVMLHVPALVMTSLIDRVIKNINEVGLSVKGFFSDNEGSLGDMYQISNQLTLGLSEKEIIDKLEGITLQLIDYEKKAREELMERRRVEIEDKVLRAYGILKYCRSISIKEAIELLALVRFGISVGIVKGVALQMINILLFAGQKSHIQRLLSAHGEDSDNGYIDYMRAKVIREALDTSLGMEGNNV